MNKQKDAKTRELADAKNDAEQIIFMTEKAIKDLGDKVDSKDKEEAEDLIKDLRKALEGDDIDEIKSLKDKLQEKAMALATKVYEEAAKANQSANADDNKDSKNDDNVREADIEEE